LENLFLGDFLVLLPQFVPRSLVSSVKGKYSGEWKMFQLSTICKRGFGTKLMFFTYGFTTFIGKKFIDSCSLGLCQMAAKLHLSAERNKAYKDMPSLLLPHPSRGRHTSLPPTRSRPASVQKMRYTGLNFVLQARETATKN
jgi:hypothetical protein